MRYLLLILLVLVASTTRADRVRTPSGSRSGDIVESSPLGVTLQRSSGPVLVPVDQIISVIYEREPSELSQARLNADNGAFITALEKLADIAPGVTEDVRVLEDIAFYEAYCSARLAIAGQGDPAKAGRKLTAFVREYRTSYHYYTAVQTIGDLWVSLNSSTKALKMYRLIAKSESPVISFRGLMLIGQMKQREGNSADALKAFEEALAIDADWPGAEEARALASLGRGVSLASLGKLEAGLAVVRKVIQTADPEAKAIQATAYNALGHCYRAEEKPTQALFAYLHVDVLLREASDQHAEALFHLVALWESMGKSEEAAEARRILRGRYAQTEWASRDKQRTNKT